MAESEPKTAKQRANAPVPSASWSFADDPDDGMGESISRCSITTSELSIHFRRPGSRPAVTYVSILKKIRKASKREVPKMSKL